MSKTHSLAEIQAKVKAPKGQYNSFGKYKYRSAEDILEAVKQVINPMGFSITIQDDIACVGDRFYIKATAILTNGTEIYSATAFAREEESKKGMDGSQVTGASSSYARKYALNGLFALDDTQDSDATNTHGKTEVKQEVKPATKTADEQVMQSWKMAVDKCQTKEELIALFNNKKDRIDGNVDIKALFTTRNLELS